MPGFPVLHHLLELAQIHVHWVNDAIQPSHLCCPCLLLPLILPSITVFTHESALCIRRPNTGASASASVLPVNIQGWFPPGLTGVISLQSKGLSRVFSSTTVWRHQFFGTQPFFIVQLSYLYMTTGKTIALTMRTFAGKVMSLLFNMLSRSVIAFLPRSKHLLNFMAAVTVHRCVALFLGSLLCSSEMHVCFCTSITLFWLL